MGYQMLPGVDDPVRRKRARPSPLPPDEPPCMPADTDRSSQGARPERGSGAIGTCSTTRRCGGDYAALSNATGTVLRAHTERLRGTSRCSRRRKGDAEDADRGAGKETSEHQCAAESQNDGPRGRAGSSIST